MLFTTAPTRGTPVVEFRILGPLEVVHDGDVVPLRRPRLRALLAMLLLHANEVVSSDRLIDALWGDAPPHNAANELAERNAGVELIRTRTPGYVIEVEPHELDLARFERLVEQGREELRTGVGRVAADVLRDALSSWRGRALADLAEEGFLRRESERLEEERIAALELRIEADLACGRHAALVGELETLVAEHPYRERLRGQLMLALYRSGRQAEALAAYQKGRRLLVDELGIEPSRALQGLEHSILLQDPGLEPPADAIDGQSPTSVREPTPAAPRPSWLVRRRSWLAAGVAVLALALAVAAVVLRDGDSRAAPVRLAPNSLGAIDPKTNRLVRQVRVGQRPTRVAVGEHAVWVLNTDDRTIQRVDPRRLEITRTIALARTGEPAGLAVGEGAVWLGTGLYGPLYLSRINPSFAEIAETVPLGRSDEPFFASRWQVAVGKESVWTVGGPCGTLLRIDPRTMNVRSRIDVGIKPSTITVGEGAVWAAGDGVVVRIDARTNELAGEWRVSRGPWGIAAGAGAIWITAADDDVVARIDAVTQELLTIPVGDLPTAVAVGDGSVWIANAGDGTVSRIDPRTRRVVATITLGASPEAIAVGEDVVYVATSAGLEQP
jgi:YVTN family beta-propeller protein